MPHIYTSQSTEFDPEYLVMSEKMGMEINDRLVIQFGSVMISSDTFAWTSMMIYEIWTGLYNFVHEMQFACIQPNPTTWEVIVEYDMPDGVVIRKCVDQPGAEVIRPVEKSMLYYLYFPTGLQFARMSSVCEEKYIEYDSLPYDFLKVRMIRRRRFMVAASDNESSVIYEFRIVFSGKTVEEAYESPPTVEFQMITQPSISSDKTLVVLSCIEKIMDMLGRIDRDTVVIADPDLHALSRYINDEIEKGNEPGSPRNQGPMFT